jgi:PIN domain nuclease of toxin-antitoxin system
VGAVLDAYALLALLADEPAADQVERLIESGGAKITSINLAEAMDVLQRRDGIPEEELREALDGLAIRVLAASESDAWQASSLRARHYDRRRRPVSIADCFLVAAVDRTDQVATADGAVLDMARDEGVGVLDLR